jgi:hypothetical protein
MLGLVISFVITGVFAEDGLVFSGEVKTGLSFEDGTDRDQEVKIANYDSAGEAAYGSPGHIRTNFHYTRGNLQFKWRLEFDAPYEGTVGNGYYDPTRASEHPLGGFSGSLGDLVKYAYGMGDFFDNQLRISAGRFDVASDSPWNVQGDELWTGVESFMSGIRTEYKPSFAPGLNAGFFLPVVYSTASNNDNLNDGRPDAGYPDLINYLREVGVGVAYANSIFEVSASGYLDGNGDGEYDSSQPVGVQNGEKGGLLLWRVNPKIISTALPGFSIWAHGLAAGLPTFDEIRPVSIRTMNYLYVKYATGKFEGKLTTGFLTQKPYYMNLGPGGLYWITRNDKSLLLKPKLTYSITPSITADLEVPINFAFGYDGAYKPDGKDPAAFSSIGADVKLGFAFPGAFVYGGTTLAGVTLTPAYHFERLFAYGANGNLKDTDVHRVELRFVLAF